MSPRVVADLGLCNRGRRRQSPGDRPRLQDLPGASTREIAKVAGVSQATASRERRESNDSPDEPPARVIGADEDLGLLRPDDRERIVHATLRPIEERGDILASVGLGSMSQFPQRCGN